MAASAMAALRRKVRLSVNIVDLLPVRLGTCVLGRIQQTGDLARIKKGYPSLFVRRHAKLEASVVGPCPLYAATFGYMQIGRVAVTAPVLGSRTTPLSASGALPFSTQVTSLSSWSWGCGPDPNPQWFTPGARNNRAKSFVLSLPPINRCTRL
jgi:hypothetical protein